RYPIGDLTRLESGAWEPIHGGYDSTWAREDPNRVVPLDALRSLEREHVFASLHDYYYVTVGVGTAVNNARRFGEEIARELHAAARSITRGRTDGCARHAARTQRSPRAGRQLESRLTNVTGAGSTADRPPGTCGTGAERRSGRRLYDRARLGRRECPNRTHLRYRRATLARRGAELSRLAGGHSDRRAWRQPPAERCRSNRLL